MERKKSIFSTFYCMAGDIPNTKSTPEALKGRFAAVLPAGGLGKRMGGNIPKQLMLLGGKPVYRYCLETFLKMDEIAEVVMAVPADWKDHFEKDFSHPKLKIVVGGAEYALVHDVARPFISEEIIRNVCKTLVEKGSCLVAKPAVDTIKIAKDGKVENTIDRNTVWLAQTPQAASVALLKKLYARIAAEPLNFTPTDEASILEYFGENVYIVKGNAANDKLTTPEDFEIFASHFSK